MIADHLTGIEQFEADLWKVADGLRANSNLASNEYFMPILGLIFLRHATNRYYAALEAIEADKAAGGMPDRPLVEDDFKSRRALILPETARFDVLLERPKDGGLGAAVASAMEDVEDQFPPLAGQLPKGYQQFEDDVLEEMMRTFDSEALRTASGDVFGRIYEYFLVEFSKQGAHDNGEFFTPPSIVQTIVNVIEPDHGVIFDPACGSGGMFVQSSHFIEGEGENTMERVTFYGHEKNETTAKLAQINLAVHGLQGTIRAGNEARLCCKLGEGAMRDQGASCSPYDSALARRSCSHAMASVRAHGPRPKARSTIRASPTMPPWRANIPAWPLRSARITSKPLIVA